MSQQQKPIIAPDRQGERDAYWTRREERSKKTGNILLAFSAVCALIFLVHQYRHHLMGFFATVATNTETAITAMRAPVATGTLSLPKLKDEEFEIKGKIEIIDVKSEQIVKTVNIETLNKMRPGKRHHVELPEGEYRVHVQEGYECARQKKVLRKITCSYEESYWRYSGCAGSGDA